MRWMIACGVLLVVALASFTYDHPRYLLPGFLSDEAAELLTGESISARSGFRGYGTSDVLLSESGRRLATLTFYADETPPGVPGLSAGPNGVSTTVGMGEAGDVRGFEPSSDDSPILDVTHACLRFQVIGSPVQIDEAARVDVEALVRAVMRDYVTDPELMPCERTVRRR